MSGPILLCLPLYREVSTEWLVRFLNMNKDYVSGIRYVRKMYLAAAMQKLVEDSLTASEPWKRLVVMEADMLPPVDGLDRIAAYPDHLDIVGSVYMQHQPPHNPVIYSQDEVEHNKFRPIYPGQMAEMMAAPGLYPVDAVGMGFTSIHRRVLENWDPNIPMWGGEMFVGHDLWFTWKAREQGFTVHVDTGIECGHLTDYPITYHTYVQATQELAATV